MHLCHGDANIERNKITCKYFASFQHIFLLFDKKAIFAEGMSRNYTYVEGAEFPWQYRYEHMAVTTDCVIFTYDDWKLKVLLVQRGGDPYKGDWALPGGFLRNDETAHEGALRELREETGLEASAIVELGVFSKVDRDPRERVITIAWYALVKPADVTGGDDAEQAAWFSIDELPDLAFDHKEILAAAMARLRRDIYFEPVGFDLLDDTFTIPDLQRLYEIILGVKFDRRNFQRKIIASGILEEAPTTVSPGPDAIMCCLEPLREDAEECCVTLPKLKRRPGRIASQFRLNKEKYNEMKEDGGKLEF